MSGRVSEAEERLLALRAPMKLAYNAAGDLVSIYVKWKGKWWKQPVRLVGVTDFVEKTYDKFEQWTEVTDPKGGT